jgi:hypothetical protein
MVTPIIKLLGTEASVNASGSTFNGAHLVRIYNSNATDVLITVTDTDTSTVTGTFTLKTYETAFVRKNAAESISAATACKMVAIAF